MLAYIHVGVSQPGLESISTPSSICSDSSPGVGSSLPLYVDEGYNRATTIYNVLTELRQSNTPFSRSCSLTTTPLLFSFVL
jgi:hypothetical protein